VREILACAAMYDPDILLVIRDMTSEQRRTEHQNASELLDHLLAQSMRTYNMMRVGPPAQPIQYPQPRYFQSQHPQAQHPPAQSAQTKPDGDGRGERQDDASEESEDDESDVEAGILSFESSTDEVEYILHGKYSDLSNSQQRNIFREAVDNIGEVVQNVANAVKASSPYITKNRAICALRNIGMMVVEADHFLGHEVMCLMSFNSTLVNALQSLYDCMTKTEREQIGLDFMEDFELLDKKRDFCFGGFDKFVKQFRKVLPQKKAKKVRREARLPALT
jgi:hypothetical protein